MKNKKKYLYLIITTLILIILSILICIHQYHVYTINFNNKINSIISKIEKEYPDINESEIIEILNSKDKSDILPKYGINIKEDSIVLENDKENKKFIIINTLFVISIILIIVCIFIIYDIRKNKVLKDITKYIEKLNNRNYTLEMDSNSEDELSILKNEIYKTTIVLKEAADNSNMDKINLKKSLEDISHQLKTPLTSILIMLDNIIDDPDMDISVRNDFIHDIKRNIININFLVQSILKLSKFDSNTITFNKKETNISDIINESIKNVSALCDLKSINIAIKEKDDSSIICDSKWQIEAITNIIKNCIEHSNKDIVINYNSNNIYSMIEIKDNGEGISKKDIKHIFERFYKGENSSSDSIGIGLALSKMIIEEDNGTISVESSSKGTIFIVKYYKM